MHRFMLFIALFFVCFVNGATQTVPTSYEAAKRVGDTKLKELLETNIPEEVHYVVLKKNKELTRLLKYDNAIYVVDGSYDLDGKTVTMPRNSVVMFRYGNISNGILFGDDSKYCVIEGGKIGCQLKGQWEKIAPIYTASELGLKQDLRSAGDHNSAVFREIVKKGLNVYLDGFYYISFSKPILLNYQLHIFGGTLSFSKYAFDLMNGGGMYANGVHFTSSTDGKTDDIVCGTREKHSAITTAPIVFRNCHFSCNRVVSLEFQYINPDQKPFGISSLEVSRCLSDRTGKFIVLDAVFKKGVQIRNNIWKGFSSVPVYLACNHSKRTNPNEVDANPWTEEIIAVSGDIDIDSNVFVGKEVTDIVYYCTALVEGKRCRFTNNYIKDIISYSDGDSRASTAYDTYLSCSEVIYKNNYVEDVMSYAKNGSQKPQCEIGKSKGNPLAVWGYLAHREYTDNIFVSDGKRFIDMGAEKQSVSVSIFNNVSPIDDYNWSRNAIIYKNAGIRGRSSSSKYRSFVLNDNYIECESLTGNLVFSNSAFNLDNVTISGNTFDVVNGNTFTLFNQLYSENSSHFRHETIDISGNTFLRRAPIYYFFIADTVRIKNNRVGYASLEGMHYLCNYTGKMSVSPVSVRNLDAELDLDTYGTSKGGARQMFSAYTTGLFSVRMKKVPERGVSYSYLVGSNHSFEISLLYGRTKERVEFSVRNGEVYYSHNGKSGHVIWGSTKPIVWSSSDGIVFKSSFPADSPIRIETNLSGKGTSDIVLEYRGK